jgi:hypothetical protein
VKGEPLRALAAHSGQLLQLVNQASHRLGKSVHKSFEFPVSSFEISKFHGFKVSSEQRPQYRGRILNFSSETLKL